MKGFIGFFDILGYRSFLENNSAIDTCEDVLRLIARSGELTRMALKHMAEQALELSGQGHKVDEFFQKSDWLVFSDTIVFTLPMEGLTFSHESLMPVLEAVRGTIAYAYAGAIHRAMFAHGLPVRGVVHYGEFVRHENCLAGRGIVEAYGLLESLDLSCVVLSSAAVEHTVKLSEGLLKLRSDGKDKHDLYRTFRELYEAKSIPYLVPMRDGSEKVCATITWPRERLDEMIDVDQYVHEMFWDHGKSVSKEAERKLFNTIKFLRFLKAKMKPEAT